MRPARILLATWLTLTTLLTTGGCSDDDDDGGSATPTASCDSMCKGAGFTSSRLDQQSNETNCFCTGAGTVTAQACTDMCKSVGKPGSVFGSGGATANACQCQ